MNINQINVNGPSLNNTDLGVNGTGSLQLLFAQLLLKLSGQAKEGAIARMQEIEKTQEDQKVCAHLLAEARKLKEEAKDNTSEEYQQLRNFYKFAQEGIAKAHCSPDGRFPIPEDLQKFLDKYGIPYDKSEHNPQGQVILTPDGWNHLANALVPGALPAFDHKASMPPEMQKYLQDHNIPYNNKTGDGFLTADEWDTVIQNLQTHLDQIGANTQQQMVYIQDLMGQYNSYLQGANTQIATSNQTTTAVAKGQ